MQLSCANGLSGLGFRSLGLRVKISLLVQHTLTFESTEYDGGLVN